MMIRSFWVKDSNTEREEEKWKIKEKVEIWEDSQLLFLLSCWELEIKANSTASSNLD